ncbi:putative transcriptional regulator [Gordonia neofelifaecis NRRL B-59395]|uniref:Putative transcriptional regulator n=1 Tax=Gordonia neofelifaecis NRRL B-59395 TaxID=644548 RepID=F1YGT5_9ACTN|nr:putative transcriptional regulator [Gordonia neofelifaecis NRRL B-59395]
MIDALEFLAQTDHAQTIAQIADELAVPRATMSAILAELDDAGWVVRDAERAYRIGPGASALAGAGSGVPTANPDVTAILAELVAATDCGVTLARFSPGRMTVVAARHSPVRPVPGLGLGQSLSIVYPVGAAVMAWNDADREAWLGPTPRREPRERLLESVRERGFAAYRPASSDALLVEVLAELLGAVGPLLIDPSLRRSATRQLAQLSSRAYSVDELDADGGQPISYLAAPVFDSGAAELELHLGVLRSSVDADERQDLATALVEAAARISALI